LQIAGTIRYSRGRLEIVNVDDLIHRSCECYRSGVHMGESTVVRSTQPNSPQSHAWNGFPSNEFEKWLPPWQTFPPTPWPQSASLAGAILYASSLRRSAREAIRAIIL
jgi:hypothetical protein